MQVEHIVCKKNFDLDVETRYKVPHFLKHLKKGQENHPDNLFPSCRLCNGLKDTMTLEKFRQEVYLQTDRARKGNNYRVALRYGQIKETPGKIVFYFEK